MLLVSILLLYNLKNVNSKTECMIKSFINWCIWLMGSIYIFSVLSCLNIYTLLFSEILLSFVLARCIRKTEVGQIWHTYKGMLKDIVIQLKRKTFKVSIEMYLMAILLFMFACVLYIAYITEPYNWDSMTYHMARLANWAQNESVLPYATHIDRQVGSTTMASYVCLYVYLLSGKRDLLLGLVQCFSYGIDAYMVYAIANKCGVQKKYSLLGSILFMALPIAFAESSTTQNDLFATMWLLFFVYLIIDYIRIDMPLKWDKESCKKTLWLASCLALGYLSKPSVCFAMVIALFWTLIQVIRRKDKLHVVIKMLSVSVITCVFFLLPSWIINFSVWGKISPDNVGARQLIGTLNYKYVFINFLKNFTYNLGNSFIPNFKDSLGSVLYVISDAIGVEMDARTISEDGRAYGFSSYPYGCDTALNPLCLLLAILLFVLLLFTWKKQISLKRQYCLFAMLAYVVFCCFLRWESFISRYMLSYFAILCPLIVIQLEFWADRMRSKNIFFIAFVIMFFGNFGLDLYNYHIENPGTYFYHQGELESGFEEVCERIVAEEYKKIGVIVGTNSYEYPLWATLREYSSDFDFEIKHILVENSLSKYEDKEFEPDCIFVLDYNQEDTIEWNERMYQKLDMENEKRMWLYGKE